MITITVIPVLRGQRGKVTIESGEAQVKEFTFHSPGHLHTFLEGIKALLLFLDIEHRIVDRRD